jgi:hypothetical protein
VLSLLLPNERQVGSAKQAATSQCNGLTSLDDRREDVGRKPAESQKLLAVRLAVVSNQRIFYSTHARLLGSVGQHGKFEKRPVRLAVWRIVVGTQDEPQLRAAPGKASCGAIHEQGACPVLATLLLSR